jgi:ABC-type molybdate transport system permease subunit
MSLNTTLFGQFIVLLMIIVGVVAYRLARRKSEHPALITSLCVLLSLFPPFAILALLILALRRDLPVAQS